MTDIEILESTYFDKCTIKRKEKIKNPNTGVTETVEKIIVEDVKCALSKNDVQSMQVDGIGKLSIYLASKPFIYPSHSQTLLTYKDRA